MRKTDLFAYSHWSKQKHYSFMILLPTHPTYTQPRTLIAVPYYLPKMPLYVYRA